MNGQFLGHVVKNGRTDLLVTHVPMVIRHLIPSSQRFLRRAIWNCSDYDERVITSRSTWYRPGSDRVHNTWIEALADERAGNR